MTFLHDQISSLLTSGEELLAVALMSRPDDVLRIGGAARRAIGGVINGSLRKDGDRHVTAPPPSLAEQLRNAETMYGAVTSRRVAFFSDHPFRINAIGAPIVGYLPEHVREYELTVRKVVDSTIRIDFSDDSSATVVLRRRREVAPWVCALDRLTESSTTTDHRSATMPR